MILLFDSSTPVAKATFCDGDQQFFYEWETGRSLAKDIFTLLEAAMAEYGWTWSHLTGVGVYQGPGSFTGLRIGLTVCNTLADALSVPVIGATGDDWRNVALARLRAGENDQIILPLYGAPAHITAPRK